MKKIILFVSAVCTLFSCSSTSYTYKSNTISNSNITASDVVVDLKFDVSKKITATSSKIKGVQKAKDEAYFKAISENNIDIVVDPIFEVRTSGKFFFFGGRSVAKLSGLGAHYVNPRSKLDAIKELKTVDTIAIQNYNYIYLGQPLKTKKASVVLPVVKQTKPSFSVSKQKDVVVVNDQNEDHSKGRFGVKIGKSANMFVDEYFGDFENNGTVLGLTYDSSMDKKFGYRAELLYSKNENFNHLNLPILLRYSISKRFKLLAGPSLTFLADSGPNGFKSTSLSFDNAISFDITKKIFMDFRYSKGILDIGVNNEMFYNSSSFGIGYRF